MIRSTAFVATAVIVASLSVPPFAAAQAQRRGGANSGGDTGSDGTTGRVAVPRNNPAPASVRERPSPPSTPREPARPSGGRAATAPEARVDPRDRAAAAAAARSRSTQAVRGQAQPRRNVPAPPPPSSGDHGRRWSPWYSYGFGAGYGYPYYTYPSYYGHLSYRPWIDRSPSWWWSGHRWHDPFLFAPYGYVSMPYYWSPSDIPADDRVDQDTPTGSVRLRVNPAHARVYIDGALAGVANEFGGLTGHLVLPVGTHTLELRADGFVTYVGEIDIRDGRTRTERVSLDRQAP